MKKTFTRGLQSWLQRKTGICQSTICDIFSGKRCATPRQAVLLEPLLLQKGINLTRMDLVFGYKKGQSLQQLLECKERDEK